MHSLSVWKSIMHSSCCGVLKGELRRGCTTCDLFNFLLPAAHLQAWYTFVKDMHGKERAQIHAGNGIEKMKWGRWTEVILGWSSTHAYSVTEGYTNSFY